MKRVRRSHGKTAAQRDSADDDTPRNARDTTKASIARHHRTPSSDLRRLTRQPARNPPAHRLAALRVEVVLPLNLVRLMDVEFADGDPSLPKLRLRSRSLAAPAPRAPSRAI